MEVAARQPLAGPAFIRLLAGVAQVEGAISDRTLLEKLGQWVDWTRAVALSRALDGQVVPMPLSTTSPLDKLQADSARIRAALVDAVGDSEAWIKAMVDPAALDEADAKAEYAGLRKRYLKLQGSIVAATGRLRGQLRDRLPEQGGELARLGEIDAVMEMVLSPREHGLLGAVPDLLGRHYQRLHAQAQAQAQALFAEAEAATATALPEDWRHLFRRDMQSVLQAELDVRFMPIDALLAAVRIH